MAELSNQLPLWLRLARTLVAEARPSVKDAVLAVLVGIFAFLVKVGRGDLDLSGTWTWQNILAALFPIVAALMVFLTWHTIKAARSLIAILKAEQVEEEYDPFPSLVLPEKIRLTRKKEIPHFRLKTTLLASLFITAFITVGTFSWYTSVAPGSPQRHNVVATSSPGPSPTVPVITSSPLPPASPSPSLRSSPPVAAPSLSPAQQVRDDSVPPELPPFAPKFNYFLHEYKPIHKGFLVYRVMCEPDSAPCPFYARLGLLRTDEVRLTVYVARWYAAKEVVLSLIEQYDRIVEELKAKMKNEGREIIRLSVSRVIVLYIDMEPQIPLSIPWEEGRSKGLTFQVERSMA